MKMKKFWWVLISIILGFLFLKFGGLIWISKGLIYLLFLLIALSMGWSICRFLYRFIGKPVIFLAVIGIFLALFGLV